MCRNFDKSYLKIANVISERSYAIRHKVGAVLVKDNRIISDGFNGTPTGFDNACENVECTCKWIHGCQYTAEPIEKSINLFERCKDCSFAVLKTKPEVLHAEANAITKVAKSTYSCEGATLYVTLSPCFDCAKLIIQAGINRVVFQELYRNRDGLELLQKAGIEVVQIENLD